MNENDQNQKVTAPKQGRRRKPKPQSNVEVDTINSPVTGGAVVDTVPTNTNTDQNHNSSHQKHQQQKQMGGGKRFPKPKENKEESKSGKNSKLSAVAAPFVPKFATQSSTGVFCTICSDEVSYLAIGVCNHPICSLCSLRLRFKSKTDDCAICKTKLSAVVVYSCLQHPGEVRFTDLGLTDLTEDIFDGPPPPGTQVDASTRMLYLNCREHYQSLTSFKRMACPCLETYCTYEAVSYTALIQHVKSAHGGMSMCGLCLDNRPLFMHEHELMTKKELQAHMIGMEHADCAFFHDSTNQHKFTTGHPKCEFCNIHVFDQLALYNHLQQQHFTCHLCDETMMFRYYQDLGCLRDHHRKQHFMCTLCDQDENMSQSDMCYSFRTAEEYRDHLRSFHAVRDCSRYMNPVGKVQYKQRNQQQQDARRAGHFDLDVGSANPFARDEILHRSGSSAGSSRRSGGRGGTGSGTGSGSGRNGADKYPSLPLPAPSADDFVPLIPPNMRIAGKISGTGRMVGLDESDLAMQAMADAAYRQAAVRHQMSYSGSQSSSSSSSASAFPSLSEVAGVGAAGPAKSAASGSGFGFGLGVGVNAAYPSVAEIEKNQSRKDAATVATVGGDAKTAVAVAQTAHPLSLVNRPKSSTASSSSSSASVAQKLRQQQQQQQQSEDKRVARNVALAEALGIASTEQHNLTTEVVGATTSHQSYRQPIMDALARYRIPATVLFAPLFPPEMISWGKKNHNELCKVERRLQALLADAKASSVALKPMKAVDRLMMHCLGKYYHFHTYEYDPEPYRYVSLVKTVQSGAPEVLLSEACLAPMFYPSKLAPQVYATDAAMLASESTPTIFLQLAEGLVQTWGRSTDRKQQSYLKPYAFNSSMVVFAEVVLKLQELLVQFQRSVNDWSARANNSSSFSSNNSYRGEDEDEHDFSLMQVAAAGPTALSVKFRDIATAQMVERLLRDLQERATDNATMVQNSTSVAMSVSAPEVLIGIFPYFRIYPNFLPPAAAAAAAVEAAALKEDDDGRFADAVMTAMGEYAGHGHEEEEEVEEEVQGEVIDSWSDDDGGEHEPSDRIVFAPSSALVRTAITAAAAAVAVGEDGDYEIVDASAAAAAAAVATGADDWEQIADQDDYWADFLAERRRLSGNNSAANTQFYRPPVPVKATATTTSAVVPAAAAAASPAITTSGHHHHHQHGRGSVPDTSDDFALALALQQQEEEAAAGRHTEQYLFGATADCDLDLEALEVGATSVLPAETETPQQQGSWRRIGKPTALAPQDAVVTAVAAEAYVPPHLRHNAGRGNSLSSSSSSSLSSSSSAPLPSTTAFIVPTATAMSEDPALRMLRETSASSAKGGKNNASASASTKKPGNKFTALLDDGEDEDDA